MENSVYPSLWFKDQAQQAADFYCKVFPDSKILDSNPSVTTFSVMNTKMMALNGGPMFQVNPAVSYYVYCGSEAEIEQIYAALAEGATLMMPLDKYDWSEKYAWLSDRYGVNWQLDISTVRCEQKIMPTLLFANEKALLVKDAVNHYTHIFSDSKILMEAPFAESQNQPEGALLFAQYKLKNLFFNAIISPEKHDFDFTHGNSFVIECKDQAEINHFWEQLGEGGKYEMCGWLVDKFGLSWQIIPKMLGKWMADPEKGQRVVEAFMKMTKFEIDVLENA